jgi:hypothetical protein
LNFAGVCDMGASVEDGDLVWRLWSKEK